MSDSNFFEPYIEKSKFDFKGKEIITLSALILVWIMIMFPLVNKIRVIKVNREVVKIEKEINSTENQTKKMEIDNTKEEITALKGKAETLEKIAEDFYKRDNVGDFLVDSITQSMAGAMFLKKVEISGEKVTINGISNEKESIAMFERNLRRIIYFEDIFIPNIKLQEEFYEFNISVSINNEEVNLKKQK